MEMDLENQDLVMQHVRMNNPLVSVYMVAYNHEKFIAQAIRSVVSQQTNFNYEIIIGEDYSTDNTRKIVKAFADKYPDKIKLILQPKNVGVKENVDSVFRACNSKYIAILEGDDYWTDPLKLQKQIDFLENNQDYSVCFHNAKIIQETKKGREWNYCDIKQNQTFVIEDILKRNFIPTASVVFRNNFNDEFLKRLKNIMAGDWFIHIYNAQFGKIYYLHDFMAIYRAHDNGQWAGLKQEEATRFKINTIFDLNKAFDYKYDAAFRKAFLKMYDDKPVGYKDVIRFYLNKFKIRK